MKPCSCLLILVAVLSLSAKEKKLTGKIPDRAALARVKSYCVDTRDLSSGEANQVAEFVKSQSQPKKLLTQLPWKLYPDCQEGDADATIRVEFPVLRKMDINLGDPQRFPNADTPDAGYSTKAVLRVSDASSAKLLYEVQSLPLDNPTAEVSDAPVVMRYNAMYRAFWKLVQDLQILNQSGRK